MGLFSKLSNLFHGRAPANPANNAMGYLNQIPGIGKEYLEPFIKSGRESYEAVNPIYNQMTKDPSAFLNTIMGNYTPSKGYQFKQQELARAMSNSAAQGGYAGTPFDQRQQSEVTQGLLNQDMQNYIANILGIQGAGLSGHEGSIGRGFQGSTGLADYLGSNLGQQAGLAFQGQSQQNANQMSRRNSILNMLGNLAGVGSNIYGFHKLGGGY